MLYMRPLGGGPILKRGGRLELRLPLPKAKSALGSSYVHSAQGPTSTPEPPGDTLSLRECPPKSI